LAKNLVKIPYRTLANGILIPDNKLECDEENFPMIGSQLIENPFFEFGGKKKDKKKRKKN